MHRWDVTNISEKARSEIITDPRAALKTYTELRDLSNELSFRNEKAWDSIIHLTEYVKASVKVLWEEMEQILSVYILILAFSNHGTWTMRSDFWNGRIQLQSRRKL